MTRTLEVKTDLQSALFSSKVMILLLCYVHILLQNQLAIGICTLPINLHIKCSSVFIFCHEVLRISLRMVLRIYLSMIKNVFQHVGRHSESSSSEAVSIVFLPLVFRTLEAKVLVLPEQPLPPIPPFHLACSPCIIRSASAAEAFLCSGKVEC